MDKSKMNRILKSKLRCFATSAAIVCFMSQGPLARAAAAKGRVDEHVPVLDSAKKKVEALRAEYLKLKPKKL